MARILLDHNVPARLTRHLTGQSVSTAQRQHWETLRDGLLLRRAEAEFDVLITCDRSLTKQNHIPGMDIAVVVIAARTNRLGDLLPLVPRVLATLDVIRPGEVVTVAAE